MCRQASPPSPRSPQQPHLSRSVREQLQNAKADAIPSALQPPFQFRDRRHTALMVLHQLAVQICEGRERYPVAGAGAAPATAGAGGAAQGTVQDGRWSLRAAHLLFRAWTVVGGRVGRRRVCCLLWRLRERGRGCHTETIDRNDIRTSIAPFHRDRTASCLLVLPCLPQSSVPLDQRRSKRWPFGRT